MGKPRFKLTNRGYFYFWRIWKTGTALRPGPDQEIWVGPFETLDKAYFSKQRDS